MKPVLSQLIRVVLLTSFFGTSEAFSQEAADSGSSAAEPALAATLSPPPSTVGRVSRIDGTRLIARLPSLVDGVAARVNFPVATGMSFETEPGATAQIRIGPTIIELAAETRLDAVEIGRDTLRFALARGRACLMLRAIRPGDRIEAVLPRGSARLLQPGLYDLETYAREQPTRVAIFEGGGRLEAEGIDTPLPPNSEILVPTAETEPAIIQPSVGDAFTERCRAQNRDENRSATLYFVSDSTTGFDDLDDTGEWQAVPGLGMAWFPADSAWVPFRQGRWSWIPPWGWTWIDDATWAFAPSHFGRWTNVEEHWAWIPGAVTADPVYAPAPVAFLGTPGFGLSVAGTAGPAVAWFPLAPGELYWPEDIHDASYLRGLNAPHAATSAQIFDSGVPYSILRGSYANRQFATVVPRQIFASSADINGSLLTVPTGRLLQAPVSMSSGIAPGARPRFPGISATATKPRDAPPAPRRVPANDAKAVPTPTTRRLAVPSPDPHRQLRMVRKAASSRMTAPRAPQPGRAASIRLRKGSPERASRIR